MQGMGSLWEQIDNRPLMKASPWTQGALEPENIQYRENSRNPGALRPVAQKRRTQKPKKTQLAKESVQKKQIQKASTIKTLE